jgi:S-DNA-T family DNA segregation ATPase FtsK/SpoIIIE
MSRRYELLAEARVRNIADYNEAIAAERESETNGKLMPYLLIVVDELAELIQVMPNEIEVPIARLAQMARAVGIHLILATQRPSVDVLTGVIKANFSSRIAFQVASRVDSRTVLDCNGAETLIGKGDMLFMGPVSSEPERVHGAFVSRQEAEGLVKFWERGWPETSTIDLNAAAEGGSLFPEVDDALFETAAKLVISLGQASASLLQRRFKIGYSRAGRLIDMLERAGIVSRGEGSKPRDVLIDEETWEKRRKELLAKTSAGVE